MDGPEDDLDVMFFWNEHENLTLVVEVQDSGEVREYDFSDDEAKRLYEFLAARFKPGSFITKVLKLFADTKK